jgi:spoIIIJ-associated protein
MRKVLEAEGRSAAEVTAALLQRLGAPQEEVLVEILDEGNASPLCLRPARVRVTHDPALKSAHEARTVVLEILRRMEIDAKVDAAHDSGKLYVTIESESGGLLIGKGGKNIDALQHIVNRIVSRADREHPTVVLDTEDYRRRRRESLEDLAYRAADRVRDTGRRIVLQEMNPHDRRIIHLALRDDPDVETQSEGEGFLKRVCVIPLPRNGRDR